MPLIALPPTTYFTASDDAVEPVRVTVNFPVFVPGSAALLSLAAMETTVVGGLAAVNLIQLMSPMSPPVLD